MTEKSFEDPFLCRKDAAKYLSFSPRTLAVWDCTGKYNLNPQKIGRSVRYRRSDLDKFAQLQTIKTAKKKSVSEATAIIEDNCCDANKFAKQ